MHYSEDSVCRVNNARMDWLHGSSLPMIVTESLACGLEVPSVLPDDTAMIDEATSTAVISTAISTLPCPSAMRRPEWG